MGRGGTRAFGFLLTILCAVESHFHRHKSTRVHENGGIAHLEYNVQTVQELVPLQDDRSVVSVKCEEDHLVVTVNDDGDSMKKWKTESLMTGGLVHRCKDEQDDQLQPFYRRVLSVRKIDQNSFRVLTEEATVRDCFRNAKVKFRWIPPPSEHDSEDSAHHSERRRRLKHVNDHKAVSLRRHLGFWDRVVDFGENLIEGTKQALETVADGFARGAAAVKKGIRKVGEFANTVFVTGVPIHWERNFTWDLFNFNYDVPTQRAEIESKTLYEKEWNKECDNVDVTCNATADVRVSCENCFAYLTSGFTLEFEVKAVVNFPPVSLMHLRAEADGTLKMNLDLLAVASAKFEASVEKQIGPDITLPTLTLAAGPVPISITPSLALFAEATIEANARGRVTVGFDYTKYMRFGTEYRSAWGQSRAIPPVDTSRFNYHPLTVTFQGDAEIVVYIKPQLTLTLWGLVPFNVRPVAYIGTHLQLGAGNGCSNALSPHYQLFGGLDLALELDQIGFTILGKEVKVPSPILPKTYQFAIIPRKNLECDYCSGCVPIPFSSSFVYQWVSSEWGPCSSNCGGGTKTRTIQCMVANPYAQIVGDESNCASLPPPAVEVACNQIPCEPAPTPTPSPPTPAPPFVPGQCTDTDNGEVDVDGDPCSEYSSSWCGQYDTEIFKSNEMCCVCGGGVSARTRERCACQRVWDWGSFECTNYCCRPDGDPEGDWCLVTEDSAGVGCQGNSWGYCGSQRRRLGIRAIDQSEPTPAIDEVVLPDVAPASSRRHLSDSDSVGINWCADGCNPAWIGDGQCDSSCRNAACGYDDGDCPLTDGCEDFSGTTCQDCIARGLNNCAWCASSSTCVPIVATDIDKSDVCSKPPLFVTSCVLPEVRIIVDDMRQELKAGEAYQIRWSGGSNATVLVRYQVNDDDEVQAGYGISAAALPNTGVYDWVVEAGILTSDRYKLFVMSTSDPSNFAVTPNYFEVDGTPPRGFEWKTGDWGPCSATCGGGSTNRIVSCVSLVDDSVASDTQCDANSKPLTENTCNEMECAVCPYVPACTQSGPFYPCHCACEPQSSGSRGEMCAFRTNDGTRFGCDIIGYRPFQCCGDIENDPNGVAACDNGCYGNLPNGKAKARWEEESRGTCGVSCGGGTQFIRYNCIGYFHKRTGAIAAHSEGNRTTCDTTQCPGNDPSGYFPCNTQSCDVYAWSIGQWSSCSIGCGGGIRNRSVVCADVNGNEADIESRCAESKPNSTEYCNTQVCQELGISFTKISRTTTVDVGTVLDISWEGGTPFTGIDIGIRVHETELGSTDDRSIASSIPVESGSFAWLVPDDLSFDSGFYEFYTGQSNQNESTSAAFHIYGRKRYNATISYDSNEAFARSSSIDVAFARARDQSLQNISFPPHLDHVLFESLDMGIVDELFVLNGSSSEAQTTNAVIHLIDVIDHKVVFESNITLGASESWTNCLVAESCYHCTQIVGCSWCETSASCIASRSQCESQQVQYHVNECRDPCADSTSCESCADRFMCMWCASSTKQCVSTNVDGVTPLLPSSCTNMSAAYTSMNASACPSSSRVSTTAPEISSTETPTTSEARSSTEMPTMTSTESQTTPSSHASTTAPEISSTETPTTSEVRSSTETPTMTSTESQTTHSSHASTMAPETSTTETLTTMETLGSTTEPSATTQEEATSTEMGASTTSPPSVTDESKSSATDSSTMAIAISVPVVALISACSVTLFCMRSRAKHKKGPAEIVMRDVYHRKDHSQKRGLGRKPSHALDIVESSNTRVSQTRTSDDPTPRRGLDRKPSHALDIVKSSNTRVSQTCKIDDPTLNRALELIGLVEDEEAQHSGYVNSI